MPFQIARTADEMLQHLFDNSIEVEGPLPTKCRIWQGGLNNEGYGQACFQGRGWLAHRLMYFFCHGPIPAGMQVQHRECDRRDCIAIDHLKLGKHPDNMRDMAMRERAALTWLSNDQVLEIRERRAKGDSCTTLAHDFKVAPHSINQIVSGLRRRHVGGPILKLNRPPNQITDEAIMSTSKMEEDEYRRQVLRDRLRRQQEQGSTYLQQYQSDLGGRYAQIQPENVVGATAQPYSSLPKMPEGNPWAGPDLVGDEPPLSPHENLGSEPSTEPVEGSGPADAPSGSASPLMSERAGPSPLRRF
jgi:hypothetical protein